MPSDEFIKSFGSYAAIVGAIVGVWTAIFSFLNWRKSTKQDMPYAYLVKYAPDKDGLVESDIVVENRSLSDIFINIMKLECGLFSGDYIPDGMGGVVGYQRGTENIKAISLLVPPKSDRKTFVRFHVNGVYAAISVKLVRQGGVFTAIIAPAVKEKV
jgi:hypothetical protein